ncbi:sugar transferase [Colwellia psychrerythraea]|uniref:Sugar transferase n=1 Tax=Colwellia psychrerythraea TaxID=28229 RepID=A0A099K925_COLPS|nr:sugar transferase [Colwellia psychrerythraea]KGJ86557.1 sugar transferase [Colwellia psychrerythraea]
MKHISFVHPSITLIKRAIDLTFSITCLLLTLPLFVVIAVMIKSSSQGSIFYCQVRVGKMKAGQIKYFNMIKFRTMVNNAEASSGAVWATSNDNRLTYVGKLLRKTRLDELPQFINVIKGEMSLIGPRPERPEIVINLEKEIPFYSERTYDMTPGITGLAQVNQGYDTCIDDVKTKIAYDFAYSLSLTKLHRWLLMDLKIIFKTLLIMVLGRGQ